MSEYCVVVAGGSTARFFTLEPAEVPEMESGPNLVEHKALANPEHRAHDDQLWADNRRGRNRVVNGPGHAYDEHRDEHEKQVDRRFARDIASEVDRMIRQNGFHHLIVCAEKRMLGILRPSLNGAVSNGIDFREIPKDLARLSRHELHEKLAGEGHLPKRKKPISLS